MNFSRKLRPMVFEEVIGQDLVKSMLKNSLFLDRIFPAYLFAGQRGCGKTTMARIFAKSLNCAELSVFRKDAKSSFPCLACPSCTSMEALAHPDFLELDAASNNGVENIRQIIDSTFYQPVLGVRRVFLIDEAHMLSKTAFNALLKILEEPPRTVTFILATTELEKIPLTIRSRAFLGLFPSLPAPVLFDYLQKVCQKEELAYEVEALWFIVRQSQGCPRDALNLLEQVFFCQPKITLAVAQQLFAYSPGESVVRLARELFAKNRSGILQFFAAEGQRYAATALFETLQALLIAVSYHQLGVASPAEHVFYGLEDVLAGFGKTVDAAFLQRCMRFLWDNQRTLALVAQKTSFLQYLLLELCGPEPILVEQPKNNPPQASKPSDAAARMRDKNLDDDAGSKPPAATPAVGPRPKEASSAASDLPLPWRNFLDSAALKRKKLLHGALCAATKVELNAQERALLICLPKLNSFLKNLLTEAEEWLKSSLAPFFAEGIDKIVINESQSAPEVVVQAGLAAQAVARMPETARMGLAQKFDKSKNQPFDFSDSNKWPKVNLVIEYFPGTVSVDRGKQKSG